MFVGSENNDSSIDDPPLYDMAEINIGHYHNSADYEDSVWFSGQPQFWIAGLDEAWRDHLEENGIYVGSRAPLTLPVNGSCGFAQPEPNTLVKEAMDGKKEDMVSLGARLIERGSAVKTATQADNDSAAEHSILSLAVSNVSEAYSQCLMWMCAFENVAGEALLKLNQDFTQVSLDAAIMASLFNAVQAGRVPESDFWQYLRDRGVIAIDVGRVDDSEEAVGHRFVAGRFDGHGAAEQGEALAGLGEVILHGDPACHPAVALPVVTEPAHRSEHPQ